ncbi:hypothetical protein N7476_010976 [Penicillium atrosanguineum]|uniref:N-glycosylation protein EOS1 n=1 Tax=Penicillium atrosanguineum TaxID=1132637 RepID=A0A9W9U027_9EURO|nr:hypothetical protein N7476_010976 [Penicillium atrosanguineum]
MAPQRNASPPPYSPPAAAPSEPDLSLRPSVPPELLRPPVTIPVGQFAKEVASEPLAAIPPSPTSSTSHTPLGSDAGQAGSSPLHPRVAVILGVDRRWYVPLLVCRALSTLPAGWWGLRCAFTFLAELLHIRPGMGREGWAAAIVGSVGQEWDVERRFRVTEVALAIMLLNYTPPAVVIRLLTTNGLIAYITSWVLYLSGASSDPRLLLPAWISITTSLTFVYHATQNHAKIKRETAASLLVVSAASFLSMSSLLLQLHLTRENEPEVPVFVITRKLWDWAVAIFLRMRIADDRYAREL